MEFDKNEWLGQWRSFESYIDSSEPHLTLAWMEAQKSLRQNFPMALLTKGNVKGFWSKACTTVTEENSERIERWVIEESKTGLYIHWLGSCGKDLGSGNYLLNRWVTKGLEGKENLLFVADEAKDGWPFRFLLAMPPMPKREALAQGGLISHLHFQFSSSPEGLLKGEKLRHPYWYATMCADEGTLLDRCNLVRALHKLPLWETLPE